MAGVESLHGERGRVADLALLGERDLLREGVLFEEAPGVPAALHARPSAGRPQGRGDEQGGERHEAFAGFQAEEEMFHWAWGAAGGASAVLRRVA